MITEPWNQTTAINRLVIMPCCTYTAGDRDVLILADRAMLSEADDRRIAD